MKLLQSAVRIAFGMLLVLHGFAHSPGVLGSWKITTFDDISYQPNVLLENANTATIVLLGALFLLAAVLFIVAGLGVIRRASWWLSWATLATVTSLAVTLLWWEDAIIGLVINLAVAVVLAIAWLRQRAPGETPTLAPS